MHILIVKSFLLSFLFVSCTTKTETTGTESVQEQKVEQIKEQLDPEVAAFISKNTDTEIASTSKGSVSNGSLENGKLLPYNGPNFWYFDKGSYLSSRGFVHSKVKKTVLDSYKNLEVLSDRNWCIMEASNQKGGKLYPHRTHQNGMSIDFMMPLKKDNKPYYQLDSSGTMHYLMTFDDNGYHAKKKDVQIDFDAVGLHIIELEKAARKNGLKIKKIIIKIELKDELYASKYGATIKKKGIYVVKGLTKMINALHDDHYHIDFEKI